MSTAKSNALCLSAQSPQDSPQHTCTHKYILNDITLIVSDIFVPPNPSFPFVTHTLLHLAHPHHHWGRPPWELRALKTPTHWLVSGNLCQQHASAHRSASTCTQSTEMMIVKLVVMWYSIYIILQKNIFSHLFLCCTNQNDQSCKINAFNVFVFAQDRCVKPGDELCLCVDFIIAQILVQSEWKHNIQALLDFLFLESQSVGCPWRILLVGTYFSHNP